MPLTVAAQGLFLWVYFDEFPAPSEARARLIFNDSEHSTFPKLSASRIAMALNCAQVALLRLYNEVYLDDSSR